MFKECKSLEMDNQDTPAPAAVAVVSVKLPPFWPVWIQQVEAQFHTKNITVDATKYYHVVAALDQSTATRLLDLLEAPPANGKYDTLKTCLLGTFGITRRQRAAQLFDIGGLGDGSPSALMDKMLALLGNGTDDSSGHMLFQELFLRQLPDGLRLQLANTPFADPREFAKLADALWEVHANPSVATFSATKKRGTSPASKERQSSSASDKNGLCYYHRKFGNEATNCRQPCKAGKGRADHL